ncbi:MAG TPA: ATP-binding protein [bacterium]|nr:ATP-binding protein [bacterium]HOL34519.1 ATP-binding protein [bacterium]HPP08069.1 ATP-binding protein [bacterium]
MREIVIISGKGGTGKTVLTACLASFSDNKVIADCDVDAANLYILLNNKILEKHDFYGGKKASIDKEKCINCGKCLALCKFNAIKVKKDNGVLEKIFIDEISCEGCGVCRWNCPVEAIKMEKSLSGELYISETKYGIFVHAKLGIAEENSGKLVSEIRKKAKEIAKGKNKNLIIIDGPPGIGCPVIASIGGVDIALIITEPTLSGLHDMKRTLQLTEHFKVKSMVIINKFDLNLEMAEEIEKYCEKEKIEVIGKISFDEKVIESVVKRVPFVEYIENETTEKIKSIWEKIEKEMKKKGGD